MPRAAGRRSAGVVIDGAAEMTAGRSAGPPVRRRSSAGRSAGYAAGSAVIGPLFAAAVLTVLVVALSLLLVGVGLAVRGSAWLTGWLANVERARARILLAAATPRLPGSERSPSRSWVGGALAPLRSSRLWRETGFLTLQMLAGPLALAMVLLVWLVPVGLMAGPVWWWAAGGGTHGVATWVSWPVALGVGCVGLLLGLAPGAVRQVGRAQRQLAQRC
jgi:hypothetical protein